MATGGVAGKAQSIAKVRQLAVLAYCMRGQSRQDQAMDTRTNRSRHTDASDTQPLGNASCFLEALDCVSRVAPLNRPVLVVGDRGTGKELVAARLHYLSRRWERPFIQLNCATLTETLLETELFGHEAGAFTGAAKRHQGRFELADGGTLFLDELATASMRVQEKLLRVIEYGCFERVGGRETVRVDVRLVAATNADLPALAKAGSFREDLLDRLAFEVITVPPLRARGDDILLLAEHFARRMSRELGRDAFAGFAPSAESALLGYLWPGNVRELKNVVERAVYRLREADQPIEELTFDPFQSVHRQAPAREAVEIASSGPIDLPAQIEAIEVAALKQAMDACQQNQKKAAEWLSMSYHQLRGYLRKYKLVGTSADADADD